MLSSLPITFFLVLVSLTKFSNPLPVLPRDSSLHKRGDFRGEGTYYDPGLGACEIVSSDTEYIAALNHVQFGVFARSKSSPACFSCAMVHGPSGSVKVKIVDMCPGCKYGDIDLSPVAFEKIARKEDGRVPISWEFVSCGGGNPDGGKPAPRPSPTKSINPPKISNPTSTTKLPATTSTPAKTPSNPYKKAPEPTDPKEQLCNFTSKCRNAGQDAGFEVCVNGNTFQQSCAPGTVCKEADGDIYCDWA
ncbi:hypothetical protein K493DRAFT_293680 [Basidiobolus meristosporus CBS 931.73]|uniref:RlpA-like protein double-psi beta-barrel domain-containing protein n=1 Tax=Basidiobolus meristosporus CBS 931.73 TaxID=1314790 RepID=A0A1Y1WX74_9FUNG|nr:hypothetical protein K493DRAFT_293680 [Basidiobolus meristosporus CBS 931.73]|eukprot:ORX77995.1 hypothetical protein K493DRAFT_293680 [Basidiobolus meristosporus CBS 931.73]